MIYGVSNNVYKYNNYIEYSLIHYSKFSFKNFPCYLNIQKSSKSN